LPFALLLVTLAWFAGSLRAGASAEGFTRIDPSRVSLQFPFAAGPLPPDWSALIARRLAGLGELSSEDDDLAERVTAELEGLPFVREVGRVEVLWPDGLSLLVRLREPVACICLGEDYLPVAADGTVLPGLCSDPPDLGRGVLPLIGPLDGAFRQHLPGDVLEEERHLDALSVAISMREFLSEGDVDALGPLVIDAERAPLAAVDEPGTRIYMEGSREIFYGRPPRSHAAGELPEGIKWRHLMDAVALLGDSGGEIEDWDLVDLRWDRPTLRPRIGSR